MQRYCAYTFDPKERPEPNFNDAVHFFQTLHRREVPAIHRAPLARFLRWHSKQRADDERRIKLHGKTRGLIHHIKNVHDWHDESKDNLKGWGAAAEERSASSNTDIGKLVDRQCHEIFTGRVPERPVSYVVWLVIYMYEQRWLPCAMQVPIWSHDNTVRTQADIIAYDMVQQRFVLIELKTGYDVNYKFEMRVRGELDFFAKSARNMCHLQLGWMYANLLRDPTHPAPLAAYVVRIGAAKGLRRPEPLCTDVLAYYTVTMNNIALHRDVLLEASCMKEEEEQQPPAPPAVVPSADDDDDELSDALFVQYPYAESEE